jgi:Na+/H+ antiporter, bacterial form
MRGFGLARAGRSVTNNAMIDKVEAVLILLGIVGVLAVISARLRVSFPIVMVLGGVVIALVPGLPSLNLDPDLILYVFLPPLLYSAAFRFPWDEFRSNMRPILAMAIGLVLATMVCVGYAAYWWIPGLPLAAAFVLGAVVSPPDAVAAGAVLERMRVPQRVNTVLEGESLVNDSSGLVAYAFAVSAVVTGSFSFGAALLDFFWMSAGGVGFGLLIGWAAARIHRRLNEPGAGMILQLITPYAAYLPADHFEVSGVLAAVTAGLYVGRQASRVFDPVTRSNGVAVWGFLNFVLNGAIFILIGLEFPVIMKDLRDYRLEELFLYGALVSAVVIAVRFAWIFLLPAVYRRIIPTTDTPRAGIQLVMSWAGMRGAVSLAAALAVPLTIATGEAFPARNLLIFLTYSVIFSTLVLQGFTLPWVVRVSGIEESESDFAKELRARKTMLSRAVEMIDEAMGAAPPLLSPTSARILREHFQTRLDHIHMREKDPETAEWTANDAGFLTKLMTGLRDLVEELRIRGEINEAIRREIEQELDAEEQRLRRVIYHRHE